MGHRARAVHRMVKTVFPNGRVYTLLSLLVALPVLLFSCGEGSVDGPSKSDDDREIFMRFVMDTGLSPHDRALGEWEQSDASLAESVILPTDVRMYVFDKLDRLIMELSDSELSFMTEDNTGLCAFTATLGIEALDRFTDVGNGMVGFKIVVFANLESAGGSYPVIGIGGYYSGLDPIFSLSPSYYPSVNRGVPMFGVGEMSVKRSEILSTDAVHPLSVDVIWMIRSVCKIEVRDAITNKYLGHDGKHYPEITGVEITGWNRSGYLRFDNVFDNDYSNDGIITSARIFADTAEDSKRFVKEHSGYRAYLPESKLEKALLKVWAVRSPGGKEELFEYRLAEADAFGTDELIRNHFYTVDVTSIGATAGIETEVKPWETDFSEITVGSGVEMAEYIAWRADSEGTSIRVTDGDAVHPTTVHIYDDGNGMVNAEFEIAAPLPSAWCARLTPGTNGVNVFEFLSGDYSSSVARGVAGVKSLFTIRCKGMVPAADCYAELSIEVRDACGRVVLAPLDDAGNTRITLIRHSMNSPQ